MEQNDIEKYIREKVKLDKKISPKAEEKLENIKTKINSQQETKTKKIIKISLRSCIAIAAVFIFAIFIGGNMYEKSMGRPNAISAIEAMIKRKEENNVIEENIIENTNVIKEQEITTNNVNTNKITTNNLTNTTTNKISKDEAYQIIIKKYISPIEEFTYIDKNVKQDGIEYYAFKREMIASDGSRKYEGTLLITLDGKQIKEIYDPNETRIEEKEPTEEEQQVILEDKYNEQVKEAIDKYFGLIEQIYPDDVLIYIGLTTEKINANREDEVLENMIYYKETPIEYSTFKNRILEYMTENMFNQFIYTHIDLYYKNVDGKLWIADRNGGYGTYHVKDVELKAVNGNIYEYFVRYQEEGQTQIPMRTMFLEIVNGKVRMSNTDM